MSATQQPSSPTTTKHRQPKWLLITTGLAGALLALVQAADVVIGWF